MAVLVAVAKKIILCKKEKPGPAATLRKQNILREARRQSGLPARLPQTERFPRRRPSRRPPSLPKQPPVVTSLATPPALPNVRHEAEDSGQFLYYAPRDSREVSEGEAPELLYNWHILKSGEPRDLQ